MTSNMPKTDESSSSDTGEKTDVLSEELRDLARRELGETPEKRQQALESLRDLLSGEPGLQCPMDEDFLIKFLRARKYDVDHAFTNIKKYFQARKKIPEVFENLGPYTIPFDAACRQHRVLTLSRKTDPEGRAVAMVKEGAWNADVCSLDDLYRVAAVYIEHLLLQEQVQVTGIVIVLDFKDFGIYQVMQYTPRYIKKILNLVQDCFPLRIKGIYVINNHAFFDVVFAIAKPFVKSKLLSRVRLFGNDLEKVRGLIPDDLIPESDGGTHDRYDYDKMERDLQERAEYFERISRCGY